jgi:hypothetical protein
MDGLDLTVSEKIKIEAILEYQLEHHESEMLSMYRESNNLEGMKRIKRVCKQLYKIVDKLEDSRKSWDL